MSEEEPDTVYGTRDDPNVVMSERVQNLASSIYKEFERMIQTYDEDVVKELMPLVVGILEGLDHSYKEKQEHEVDLELLRDDNEQLLTQYEREKQLRKAADQKCLELEDQVEEERKELQAQVESLESNVRMFELKAKNAQDHIMRLEEKETEMKKEYTKVHDRYTELLKTHMDYMERTKLMLGGDHRIMDCGSSPRTGKGFQLPILRPVNPSIYSEGNTPIKTGTTPPNEYDLISPGGRSSDSNVSLKHELRGSSNKSKTSTVSTGQVTDNLDMKEISTGTSVTASMAPPADADLPSPEVPAPKLEEHAKDSVPARNMGAGEDVVNTSAKPAGATDTTGVVIQEVENLDPGYADMITSPDMEEIDDSGFDPAKSASSSGAMRTGNESSVFDELSRQDLGEIDDGMDITGMSKEVENLILENTELLATKNALNVVKDDLIAKVDELSSEQEILREEIASLQANKEKLRKRVSELEEELKKAKEELDKMREKGAGVEDGTDEDVPMAQRKRFTRVEMARVLMERNQYKERLMELQEAVRWTEMIRASREHPDLASTQPQSKKKGNIWNFFGNLFNASPAEKPKTKKGLPSASVKYNAPTSGVKAVGDPNKKNREKYNMGDKAKAYDFLQDEAMTEKARKEREKERKEQYKQVRAHVKKDDGRMQAYGWSLPAKFPAAGSSSASGSKDSSGGSKTQVPVPVPVYCRPLIDKDSNMKIWCAAGVNITMGRTKDGGSVVGASVFYSDSSTSPAPAITDKASSSTDVEKLDQELKEHEAAVREGEEAVTAQSSLLWICTTEHNSSQVTVVDANNPGDILDAFHVTSSHILCIASVPGAVESDYTLNPDEIVCESEPDPDQSSTTTAPPSPAPSPAKLSSTPPAKTASPAHTAQVEASHVESKIGGITFVQCATGGAAPGSEIQSPVGSPAKEGGLSDLSQEAQKNVAAKTQAEQNLASAVDPNAAANKSGPPTPSHVRVIKATGIPASPQPLSSTTATSTGGVFHSGGGASLGGGGGGLGGSELIQDGLNSISAVSDVVSAEADRYTSVAPTMWLGAQSGSLYVHSAVSHWKKCLHSVKLKDSILNIVHLKGRVFVALADGTVAVFHRSQAGQWDLRNYHLIDLGKPHNSVRCICVVGGKHLWCGYRNRIHVLDPKTLQVQKSFDAHPRKESNIRQLAWVGDGVWVSIRLDSTLRLYHAYTHQHLQDVDIEPYVSKMLGTGKLGFSFVRITALLVSCNRLWIGTGNGVIISVPLSEANKQAVTKASGGGGGRPGGVIRVYSDHKTDGVTPGSFIPYCSMAQAQLSFHGHKDAVKFFVAVPGAPRRSVSNVPSKSEEKKKTGAEQKTNMLVISGGEGYIDFRLGDAESDGEGSEGEPLVEKKPSGLSKGDRSHLIVWQVLSNTPQTTTNTQ